jgi:hypothetical protein
VSFCKPGSEESRAFLKKKRGKKHLSGWAGGTCPREASARETRTVQSRKKFWGAFFKKRFFLLLNRTTPGISKFRQIWFKQFLDRTRPPRRPRPRIYANA